MPCDDESMKKFRIFTGFIALLVVTVFSSAVYAIGFGGLGGHPANPDPENELTKSWFIYEIEPGSFVEDAIVVQNLTEESKNVVLYPADTIKSSNGGFALKQMAEEMTEVGSWIDLEESEFVLAAGQSKEVAFTLTVPEEVDIGEHTAGIMIEESGQEGIPGEGGASIGLRTGVRIYVTVPGDVVKIVTLADFENHPNGGIVDRYVSSLHLKNEGNVSNMVNLKLHVQDVLFGNVNEVFYKDGFQVLRDDEAEINFEWGVPYFGKVMTFATIEYEGTGGEEVIVSDVQYHWILPWNHIYAIGYTLGSLIILVMIAQIMKRLIVITKWDKYKIKKGDTLMRLAAEYDLKWKKIAKANRLRKPYDVQLYEYIRLPRGKMQMAKLKKSVESSKRTKKKI